MNVLLSLKPDYAAQIVAGEKQYEFRKSIFKDPHEVGVIYIYVTSPVKQIIGYFSFENVVESTPVNLWRMFKQKSGVESREKFMTYFSGHERGYAIKIKDVYEFPTPIDPWNQLAEFNPPVSFKYIDGELETMIKEATEEDKQIEHLNK